MNRPTRNTAAGRAYLDLQNRARRERRGTQELLTMYVVERWLARLSRSPYAADLILKGGMLLAAFGNRRPTVDVDALARNMAADQDAVARRVVEIAALADPDDGVEFLTDTVSTTVICDDALYSGVRVVMRVRIAAAQVKLRLDINFGDPVTPAPLMVELPALRPGVEPVHLLGYPVETVLAEKLATAIELGPANTRVRDYADIYVLTGAHVLDRSVVREALDATAAFRGTRMRSLSEAIGNLAVLRSTAYAAYCRNLGPNADGLPERFDQVVTTVVAFADSVINASGGGDRWNPRTRRWEEAAS